MYRVFFFFILPSSKGDLRVSNLCTRASNDSAITAMLTTSSLKAYCYVQNCACVCVFYYEGSKVGLLQSRAQWTFLGFFFFRLRRIYRLILNHLLRRTVCAVVLCLPCFPRDVECSALVGTPVAFQSVNNLLRVFALYCSSLLPGVLYSVRTHRRLILGRVPTPERQARHCLARRLFLRARTRLFDSGYSHPSGSDAIVADSVDATTVSLLFITAPSCLTAVSTG